MLRKLKEKHFDIHLESHAAAILEVDFPEALINLESVLTDVAVPIREIIGSGGGESKGTQRLRHALNKCGWNKTTFEIKKTINDIEKESISHEVDHVREFKGPFEGNKLVALEIEWNNKDPFFDRDLENFKRLHAEGAISVGVIVTRGASLQDGMRDFVLRFALDEGIATFEDVERLGLDPTRRQRDEITKRVSREKNPIDFATAWTDSFVSDKYGEATTHWRKLMNRVSRGVGNPCPLLLIGLPASIVMFES
ncbi:MAG: BglII/BstYI family type II restriction endonuclease [Terriglobales bacterium]